MRLTRSFGVQLHPTSLPGGRLGPEAYAFVDWLREAGARWWQVLPLHPPDKHGSPYASPSGFAGWEGLLADPDARVAASDTRAFRRRAADWLEDWIAFAGADALVGQVRFAREWDALRAYAAANGIRVIGDLPIYVAPGGCDQISHPELFLPLDDAVAGVPPDALNPDGQLWGNPLYDWKALARTGFAWWIARMRRALELADVFRIDHFRGFVRYWAVPAGDATARSGRWRRGPGRTVFDAAQRALGDLPVIAEDLGVITKDVRALRDELGLPGMAVMIWAFSGRGDNPHRLENHRPNQVVYTSTHDTDTLAGAFGAAEAWPLLERALASVCALAVVPAQDVLALGSAARMNRPGTTDGNWTWRLEPGQLTASDAARLRRAAEATARV